MTAHSQDCLSHQHVTSARVANSTREDLQPSHKQQVQHLEPGDFAQHGFLPLDNSTSSTIKDQFRHR
jgi:hypothetical protein